jgi:hypothetical protein
MPITRKFVAQNQEECQILKMDSASVFLVNDSEEWQFLFGPNSTSSTSDLRIKIAAQFNTDDFDGIKIIAYLYESQTGSVSSLGSCSFNVYKVVSPDWEDVLIGSFAAAALPSSYYYKQLSTVDLLGLSLDGETSIMIEATGIRLGQVYRDRIYVNHLGIYDSFDRLKKEVEWLDISKVDE